ncbi:XTP/dITP diphosphatase [Desulfocurvibacter africanus]|uniref:dITP/XTP pyrophosphatase n=1 Tax=Desulfocurvibacter africanus subsp. africanus str. Walvis Bay TaxID=690850 RepID=F3Z0S8_DESAF|nr:XTP/dITP diphosphatase [Desulfocurvibacter africanus]EGJ49902.1 Nucleoside-triphosphatase rdgB [Desulfocurvibacter africanus subsp. africanus str. Walvis Bay]
MQKIVLATRNRGKIAELSAMLGPLDVEVVGLDAFPEIGEIPETGKTFEENALIKARAVCQAAGLPALADDSGLVVDALAGAPGVYSARFAGERATDADNNAKLLREMATVPPERRSAHFVCVVAAVAPNGATVTARGTWDGEIARKPKGQGGFGYDPLFLDPELGMSAAELDPEQKNARSHRGRALRKLMDIWPDFWKKISASPGSQGATEG